MRSLIHPLGGVIDLNFALAGSQPSRATPESRRELGHVRGQAGVLAADRSPADAQLAAHGGALWRRSLGQELHMPGPVPGDGVRAVDVSREPARHRDLPLGAGFEALPYGLSRPGSTLDAGGRERDARLAHLRGFRPAADRSGEEALCRHGPRARSDQQRLCAGLHDDRPVSVGVSLGAFPNDQIRGEDAHPARFARQYPELHPHLGWQSCTM